MISRGQRGAWAVARGGRGCGWKNEGKVDGITRARATRYSVCMRDITRTCNFTITANLLTLENSPANCWGPPNADRRGATRRSCGGHYVKQFKLFSERRLSAPNDHHHDRDHRYFHLVSVPLCSSRSERQEKDASFSFFLTRTSVLLIVVLGPSTRSIRETDHAKLWT